MSATAGKRRPEEPLSFFAIGLGLSPMFATSILLLVRDGITSNALGVAASLFVGVLLLASTAAILAWFFAGKRRVAGGIAFVLASCLCCAYPAFVFAAAVFGGSGATP